MDITRVLEELYHGEWITCGETYESIEWVKGITPPTEQEITDAWPGIMASRDWSRRMQDSDVDMTRVEEDIITHVGVTNFPQAIQDKHAAKLALRAEKPE